MCSDGSSDSYREDAFKWTAPVVDAPKEVTITPYVTNEEHTYFLCVGKHAIEVTVLPRPEGEIELEKILDSNLDDIEIGDTISYRIIITNIGETKIVFLPLSDDYPEAVL